MIERPESKYQKKIITIPNMISFFRLCLIPMIVWLYCTEERYGLAAFVLAVSGGSDMADGIIARKFHMTSDFGKALDPIADKLTQAATLFCLVTRFNFMVILLILLVVKELFGGITSLIAIKRTGVVLGAEWHGKITTAILYLTMFLHIVWWDIPGVVSNIWVLVSSCMMLISLMLYGIRNIGMICSKEKER